MMMGNVLLTIKYTTKEALINSSYVIPAYAGIQQHTEYKHLDSGSALRFARNDELIRDSLNVIKRYI